ncbi:MAG: glycosyltransferase family 2 protein [Acidobacteria bacterium]|nr:glycosyltransferase family 2 protein [Acidobacteriota bacterium]
MVAPRVAVVIPALNEAASIGAVLAELPRPPVMDVIVVDGGSSDQTRSIAERRGARVIVERRRGYGRACLTGLEHTTGDADIVVFLDADYSDRPAELTTLIEPIARGRADMVIGSRLAGRLQPGALPWHSRVGNRMAASLMRILYRVKLTDLGPFRAVRADLLRSMPLREQTYGWPVEMIARAARAGWRVVEVPVTYYPRIGESKITGTIRGSIGAAWFIMTRIFVYRFGSLGER